MAALKTIGGRSLPTDGNGVVKDARQLFAPGGLARDRPHALDRVDPGWDRD